MHGLNTTLLSAFWFVSVPSVTLWLILLLNPQRRDDEAADLAVEVRDARQVPDLLEAQRGAQSAARLVVVEVHGQERRHTQPRTRGDHPLHQFAAEPALLVRGGDIHAHFRGRV